MQEDIFNIRGKIGNKEQDINYIYVLAKKNNTFDVIYIKYNDGSIKKINKPDNQSYKEFAKTTNKILVSLGATSENKRKRWNVLEKKNSRGVNFDYLENSYQNQLMSDDIISFNVNNVSKNKKKRYKKVIINKLEELEELDDDYAIYKTKMIRNLLVASALAFVTLSPIEGPWSYLDLKNNVTYTVDAMLLISALIDGIIMYGNKKIRKKLETSI